MAHSKGPVPPAWRQGALSYSTGLTYDTAKKMVGAAAEARKQRLAMVVAIADAGGSLVAFARMDDAMLASIHIATDKAFTAAYGKIPTQIWRDIVRSGNVPPLFIHKRWTAFPGGFPLIKGKKLLGGIGCSGATAYGDTSVARAGLRAGGFSTEDADAILKQLSED